VIERAGLDPRDFPAGPFDQRRRAVGRAGIDADDFEEKVRVLPPDRLERRRQRPGAIARQDDD